MGDSGIEIFNTREFFEELRARVIEALDREAAEAGISSA